MHVRNDALRYLQRDVVPNLLDETRLARAAYLWVLRICMERLTPMRRARYEVHIKIAACAVDRRRHVEDAGRVLELCLRIADSERQHLGRGAIYADGSIQGLENAA